MQRFLATAGLALTLCGAGLAPAAHAADSAASAQTPAGHFTIQQAADFSKQIEDNLAAQDARVGLIFRSGRPRDKLPEGMRYTHGAFWVYRDIAQADGTVLHGYAVYNLYAGDGEAVPKDRSTLVQDYPLDFVRGSFVDDVAVIIPTPEMQRRILAVIDGPTYAAVHNPHYSLIANPLSDQRQNCTGFMLDVVAAAAWQTSDPRQIRANLRAHFTPSPVKVNGLALLFGPLVDKRLSMADQQGGAQTTAYESLARFMQDNGLSTTTYALNFQRQAI